MSSVGQAALLADLMHVAVDQDPETSPPPAFERKVIGKSIIASGPLGRSVSIGRQRKCRMSIVDLVILLADLMHVSMEKNPEA